MTESELMAIVKANIRRYREFRKWTQAQLAEKLDISTNYVSGLENGKRWPSRKTMVKFAEVLNIQPFELFKPAEAPEAAVSDLFARYNKEVVQVISDSINETYNYYQAIIDKKQLSRGGKNRKNRKIRR